MSSGSQRAEIDEKNDLTQSKLAGSEGMEGCREEKLPLAAFEPKILFYS